MTVDELLGRLRGVRQTPRGWEAYCPAHDDRKRSLTIAVGDSGAMLLKCHAGAGCPLDKIVTAIGITKAELFTGDRRQARATRRGRDRIVATYDYRDENGVLLFQAVRYEPKAFAQRRPDGNGGWIWNLKGVRRVLYRLPELLAADPTLPVYKVEGEKDAKTLADLGLVATTNPGGAGKWRAEYNEHLRNRDVVLLPDHDDAGRKHADQVAASLRAGIAGSVRIVTLPGLAEKGDVSDWLAAGGTRTALEALVAATSVWTSTETGHEADTIKFFDEKDHFIPARLGAQLMAESTIRLGDDRRLWRYVNGVYRPDGDDWARLRTRELVGERFRRNHLEEVSAYLRAQLPTLGHTPHGEFINCPNGLLEWRTGVLHPHSPKVLSTNQIAVVWNPRAVAPRFESFLREVLPEDAIDLVEELIGYALYPGNPFRKAVMLLGSGGNGKSVLLRLITALLANENVAAVSLQALGEDRFSAVDLFGKLANICGDLDARAIERTDLFKQITGGDPIRAQHKFRDAFSFVSYALPFFSANEAPRTADQTDAWFDRWIIVPMEQRFEGTPDEDIHLSDKLNAELAGVLVRAVAGLRRLMERGRFAFPPSVERTRDQYRQTLDTVRAFITELCHFDPDGWVDRARLYSDYRAWCKEGGRLALANTTFNAHLLQAYGSQLRRHKRVGRPGWMGLALGPSPEDGDGDVGDVGDAFSTSSNRVRARVCEEGEKVRNASPTSPTSPNGSPPADDPDDEVTEWRRWP